MEVALADAEARLGELINRVTEGEIVAIMRDGQLVARLVPPPPPVPPTKKKPVDVEAIRAVAATLQFDPEPAGEFMRRLRESERY